MKKLRLLLADDHGVLRAGLRALLNAEPDFEVVGEVGDGAAALTMAAAVRPDVLLMDLSMPGLGGIEATRQVRAGLPAVRVLILTAHEDTSLLRAAVQAGASGYIVKSALEADLVNAIRAVARGELYVHPALTRALLTDAPARSAEPPAGAPEALSAREVEVLRLIARGHTNRQIAEALNLGIRTVESHRANLMDKLGLRSRVELVRYASEHHYI